MADLPQNRVAPYAQINSPIPSSGLHNLDVLLAKNRKHGYATSSDLAEPPSKRGVLSDSHGHVILGSLPSSPPISRDSDTEEDENWPPSQPLPAMPSFSEFVPKHASRSDSAATLVASPGRGRPIAVARRMGSAALDSVVASRGGSLGLQTPLAVIRDAVDTGCETLNLAERDIDELPSEIGDLRHWVSLDRPTLKVCLGNNNLRHLHLGLFDVNISELLVRSNRLEEIPQQIGQLRNLQELSVGQNNLQWLPAELLTLPKLTVLSTVPNPWLELPNGVQNTSDQMPSFVFRQVEVCRRPPTLVELAQRVLADHALLGRDRRSWALSEHQQRLVDAAMHARRRGRACFHCRRPFVRPAGYATEWWNLCHNKALPFRKFFCTQHCLRAAVYEL